MAVTLKFTVFGDVDFVVREIFSTLRKKVLLHFQGIIIGDSFNRTIRDSVLYHKIVNF